ncbi:hypothetical protein U9M48_036837 [Paspalum notatum var. saurae]|uniref:Integrase catalytic domain-containing protein n=1 Tax=Paspalum notatum var. saurae TaxID=547442 RepID=A0AAQ3UF82_PASNO
MGGNKYGFHCGVTRDSKGYNSIRVVVDRLTKVAHFIPVNTTYSGARLAELYISQNLHISFRERLHDSLDSKLRFSTAYHPQIDGQTERTN